MGPERLTSFFARKSFAVVAALVVACGSGPAGPPPVTAARSTPASHLQIVHAMTTPGRHALVERFKQRNPTSAGSPWTVNEEALGMSLTVVDPFAGFVRRARRGLAGRPSSSAPIAAEQAASSARDFVKRNADLLGLPRHVVPGLAEHTRTVEPSDHASPRAAHAVRFDAPFASKGYEAFKEIDNLADLEVFVDDDGEVSSFVNLSRVHPRLTIDTRPRLKQEDPLVVARLVGRSVFALVDEAGAEARRDVRELRRIPLGQVRADEVTHMQLVIHASTGPQLAWLTYRLAYFVEVAKPAPPTESDDAALPPHYFFFRYVVDADTGDVLEDARAPFSTPAVSP